MLDIFGEPMSQEDIRRSAKASKKYKSRTKRKFIKTFNDNDFDNLDLISPKKNKQKDKEQLSDNENKSQQVPVKIQKKNYSNFRIENVTSSHKDIFWVNLIDVWRGSKTKDMYWPTVIFPQSKLDQNVLNADILKEINDRYTFPLKPGFVIAYLEGFFGPKAKAKDFVAVDMKHLHDLNDNKFMNHNRTEINKANKNKSKFWTKSMISRYDNTLLKIKCLYAELLKKYKTEHVDSLDDKSNDRSSVETKTPPSKNRRKRVKHLSRTEHFKNIVNQSKLLATNLTSNLKKKVKEKEFSNFNKLV